MDDFAHGTPPDDDAIAQALGRWALTGSADPLPGGAANEHWRVASPERTVVLRRYHPRRSADAIAYEHRLLRFLAERDWPVAAPLPTAGGEELVEAAGARWALFPFLPGEPAPDDLLHLQRTGALLALLHADLQAWPEVEQRPGWRPVSDLDGWVAASSAVHAAGGAGGDRGVPALPDLDAFLRWLAEADPERARALGEMCERNAEELDRLGYAALVETAIYAECFGANVLFSGDTVTALLDFDSAYRDARIADIARSLVVDCGPDAERIFRWVGGYAAHAEPRILALELDLLPAVMLAWELWHVVVPAAECAGRGDDPAAVIAPLASQIDVGLPTLESAAVEVRRAARRAAHPANRAR